MKFEAFGAARRAMTMVAAVPLVLAAAAAYEYQATGRLPQSYRVLLPVPPAQATELPSAPAPEPVRAQIDALVRGFDGVVGVAVRSVDDGWAYSAGGERKLPQQSVSKLWVAMTVLDHRDQGKLRLEDPITITRSDFTLFHQPIASLVKDDRGYTLTVGELMHRALTMSDNTANDKLLRLVGGPEAVRDFIRRKGLGAIRFGPGEKLLQAGTAGLVWRPEYAVPGAFDRARSQLPRASREAAYRTYVANPPDGAAPAAIAAALARLKEGQLLSAASTSWLITTMQESHTGRQRLRGAVPPGWLFGHKTGTGQDLYGRTAGYNDVGILTAPDGKTYTVAVMIGDTARAIPARQQLMQGVLRAVIEQHRDEGAETIAR